MGLVENLVAYPAPLRTEEDGTVRVGASRVRLDTVITAYQNGRGAEEIVLEFPTLNLTDVYAVITYYLWHREEVDAYLETRQRDAMEIQRDIEATFPPDGILERLRARSRDCIITDNGLSAGSSRCRSGCDP